MLIYNAVFIQIQPNATVTSLMWFDRPLREPSSQLYLADRA